LDALGNWSGDGGWDSVLEFADSFCLMILDGAGWHHPRDLALPDNLRLLFLRPYSPELNPVEHV